MTAIDTFTTRYKDSLKNRSTEMRVDMVLAAELVAELAQLLSSNNKLLSENNNLLKNKTTSESSGQDKEFIMSGGSFR